MFETITQTQIVFQFAGCFTAWWFQPIWKMLVKMGSFLQIGLKIKKWNRQPVIHNIPSSL